MNRLLMWLRRGMLVAIIFGIFLIVVSVLIARSSQPKSFAYSFNNTNIKFPISVREAIKRYNTAPHQYIHTEADLHRPTACQQIQASNKVSELFYVDSADDFIKAPSDSLDREVYAIRFCYRNGNRTKLVKLMNRLEKDFGKPFELKVSTGGHQSYYELDNSWQTSIVIDFCPDGVYKPDAVKTGNFSEWTVNFCYGIKYGTISNFVDYERAYDAQ